MQTVSIQRHIIQLIKTILKNKIKLPINRLQHPFDHMDVALQYTHSWCNVMQKGQTSDHIFFDNVNLVSLACKRCTEFQPPQEENIALNRPKIHCGISLKKLKHGACLPQDLVCAYATTSQQVPSIHLEESSTGC